MRIHVENIEQLTIHEAPPGPEEDRRPLREPGRRRRALGVAGFSLGTWAMTHPDTVMQLLSVVGIG